MFTFVNFKCVRGLRTITLCCHPVAGAAGLPSSLSWSSSPGARAATFARYFSSALVFLRVLLQLLLQVVTSSQQLSHFLRQLKGLLQMVQILKGRSDFFTPRGIAAILCSPCTLR
eukprot:TRINITY_DN6600_c0_g1_i1.p1 TRINITY_DN6600_c0_g1~~TRINITY_DN6600_c0_g1_i1.p1  ORF type:complete len:115 (+),score=4.20 TRINITY_DN6600_c0_g1_i1:449-793(+)